MITDYRLLALAASQGLLTPEEIEAASRPPEPDPFGDLLPAERLEAVIANASSGAPAFAGVDVVVEEVSTGRQLPAPGRSSAVVASGTTDA